MAGRHEPSDVRRGGRPDGRYRVDGSALGRCRNQTHRSKSAHSRPEQLNPSLLDNLSEHLPNHFKIEDYTLLARQKKPAGSTPVRPSLNEIQPYASISARGAELTRREDELTAELRPLVAEIRERGGYAERGGMPVRPSEGPSDYRPGVREMIADVLPFQAPAPRPLNDLERKKARAAEISAELADITEAKKRLLVPLNQARAEASAKVCDEVRPAYAAIAQRAAAALAELGEAWAAHRGFLRELASDGVSAATLQQIQLDVGDDRDPLAVIGRALNRAAVCGGIDPNAAPPEWLVR
jgi:hypothetical protein